eukprot:TRINITY_DN376_c0_g1_i10.p1 TRINITY_DN376_c0_g1~~TRINITY_DN376_c0_g1_i10.p1  ORF type:complete len:401 (-),score=131.74 TRINITY_DN376_c0_g1_i10:228-1430(-)
MGDLVGIRDKAMKIGSAACELDKAKKYEEALKKYIESIELFQHVIKYESNKYIKDTLRGKAEEYLNRASEIKKYLKNKKEDPLPAGADNNSQTNGKKGSEEKKDENAKLKEALGSAVITEKPNIKWDDVAGLEKAKSTLQEAVILPTKFPQLFVGKIRPWSGILLYGPPGTGKSYLAKACATEAQGTFFSVSSSDLVSKWLGESERLVRSLFEMARANRPSIIFIDEIDSLCSSRSEGENDTTRRIKTEFLVQMQGVGKGSEGLLVLGATNVPWELDPAVRRRFEKRIYISLPDKNARKLMFKLNLGTTPNSLAEEDYERLGEMTENYSGSDISTVVKDALMEPIRKCQSAVKFSITADGFFVPTSVDDPTGQPYTLHSLPDPSKLRAPIICFVRSLVES